MKFIDVWRIIVSVVLTIVFVNIVFEAIKSQSLELKDVLYGLLVLACLVVYVPSVFKLKKDKKQNQSD